MANTPTEEQPQPETIRLSGVIVAMVVLLFDALALQTVLQIKSLAGAFVSPSMWPSVVTALGGTMELGENGEPFGDVGLIPLVGICVTMIAIATGIRFVVSRLLKLEHCWPNFFKVVLIWSSLPAVWLTLWLVASTIRLTSLTSILMATPQFWLAVSMGGVLSAAIARPLDRKNEANAEIPARSIPKWLWAGIAVYALVFTAMNWGLYFNLMLPHGDSAMYEEHLWNIWHGKGFRSYLDQGLFLGEHIQVIHLVLLPIHFVWPSQLMLELSESLVIATGALPVFWMAKRHCQNSTAAVCLALAYLLSFPVQFLDISVDLKTFRPIVFGMTAMLFAIDQFERGRFWSSSLLFIIALSAKEDFAIVTFCFGAWVLAVLVWDWWKARKSSKDEAVPEPLWRSSTFRFGVAWAVCSPIYLKAALAAIVWFRDGVEVHYASYFEKFGDSTSEIVWNIITNPLLVIGELANGETLIYALCLLVPLGFLPLLSPTRLLSCGPLFALLCLNELARDPRHHFHAPLMPLVLWAAAAGLGNLSVVRTFLTKRLTVINADFRWMSSTNIARFACCSAFSIGLWFSISPLGVPFWDPGSIWQWKKLYVPDDRVDNFAKVLQRIPKESRVASTDYIHTRFTHYERSYDYSDYKREVAGGTVGVPDDTDYIVIDTGHRYSKIKQPSQVREIQQEPDNWQVLPDETNGYFIILKRVSRD